MGIHEWLLTNLRASADEERWTCRPGAGLLISLGSAFRHLRRTVDANSRCVCGAGILATFDGDSGDVVQVSPQEKEKTAIKEVIREEVTGDQLPSKGRQGIFRAAVLGEGEMRESRVNGGDAAKLGVLILVPILKRSTAM